MQSQLLGPNPQLRTIAQIDSNCFLSVSERRKQPTSGQGATSVRDTDSLGLFVMDPGLGTVGALALGLPAQCVAEFAFQKKRGRGECLPLLGSLSLQPGAQVQETREP